MRWETLLDFLEMKVEEFGVDDSGCSKGLDDYEANSELGLAQPKQDNDHAEES